MSSGLPLKMKSRARGSPVSDVMPPRAAPQEIQALMHAVQHVTGVILLVQEHRFQLETEQGTRLNFMLRHDAGLEWRDLLELEQSRRPVEVIFQPSLHLSALAVSEVRELPAHAWLPEAASPNGETA